MSLLFGILREIVRQGHLCVIDANGRDHHFGELQTDPVTVRFRANWERAKALYDERFCRMWEFYLAGSEMGFRHQGLMVFQLQLAKRVDVLPLIRDYMTPQSPEAAQPTQTKPRAQVRRAATAA